MEHLIRDLNSPQNQGNPDAINTIQRQLQRLQREPTAWQTGLELLNSHEPLLQFYGALTLGQKVKVDWERDRIGGDREHVSQLLEHLLTCYVRFATAGSEVVVTKLSSVLAAVFAKPTSAWAHPLRHALSCILAGRYLPEKSSASIADILGSPTTLSGATWKAVLRLALALQEEHGSSAKGQVDHRYEIQLTSNAPDVWQLLHYTILSFSSQIDTSPSIGQGLPLTIIADRNLHEKLLAEALHQVPLWTKFVAENITPFSNSIQLLLHLLEQPLLAEYCMPCVATLQGDYYRLLNRTIPDYRSQVNNSAAANHLMDNMLSGYFSPDGTAYVEFLEAVVSQLDCTNDQYLKDPEIVVVLERVQKLTGCQGAAMVEDDICQIVLEMMTTVAEGYNDWDEPSQFDDSLTNLIKDVCLATLVKVQYPSSELDKQTAIWDEDEHTRFGDFRFQAKDFFETAFGILGPGLAQDIARTVTQSAALSWSEFEAGLFVLTSISDALTNDPEKCDSSLAQIFSSELWTQAISDSTQIPGRVRRAVIRLLAEATTYLQRNPQFMISSLDFLFRCLQIKAFSNQAAGAIHNLCDSQRTFLVQGLPQFLGTITTLNNISLHSRGKVLSGIAALIQALPSEEERIEPLQKMLQLVQSLEIKEWDDINIQDDDAPDPLFDRVSMLAAIAKGLQSPSDTPIDLETPSIGNNTFWTNGPGTPTQQAILQMLSESWSRLLEPQNGDLVAVCCELLRAGFKEAHPSPFKFAPITETELLCALIDLRNSNLDQTMNTSSCFVSAAPPPMPGSSSNIERLLQRVIAITKEAILTMNSPIPDASFNPPSSICDFIVRCMPKFGVEILGSPSALELMTTIFDFTILLLRSTTDVLPRRIAAAFFTSFLDLTEPSSKFMHNTAASFTLTSLLDTYSPTILGSTLHLLAGECARSEIEVFSQLLRAFILKQPMRAKRIMQEAIKPESAVLTQKALEATKSEQRARFVAQVEALRGGRKTNEIVRDFWISCKGGQFGYVT
ncbi:member of the karyopherin-beta [Lithohypha guttulata]|uniref:Member of the karyopherin-beta n=1 Tax=Lithohypha guttulata TaxID=1690604 RepID=A0AAN7SVV3_9EURO|nr:member of the karyopherin-beta [Lithohypha guttulata]